LARAEHENRHADGYLACPGDTDRYAGDGELVFCDGIGGVMEGPLRNGIQAKRIVRA